MSDSYSFMSPRKNNEISIDAIDNNKLSSDYRLDFIKKVDLLIENSIMKMICKYSNQNDKKELNILIDAITSLKVNNSISDDIFSDFLNKFLDLLFIQEKLIEERFNYISSSNDKDYNDMKIEYENRLKELILINNNQKNINTKVLSFNTKKQKIDMAIQFNSLTQAKNEEIAKLNEKIANLEKNNFSITQQLNKIESAERFDYKRMIILGLIIFLFIIAILKQYYYN